MQKHFSNRTHNFGEKLAGLRNRLSDMFGVKYEKQVNAAIMEVINKERRSIDELDKIEDKLIERIKHKIHKSKRKNERYDSKLSKHQKSIIRTEPKEIANPVRSKLKALPAIVTSSNNNIDEFAATTHRYKSFDRGKRKLNKSTLLPEHEDIQRNTLRNNRTMNRSVDEDNSRFDPLSSIINLNKNIRNNERPTKLDPISSPVSPAPYNTELWPRTIKNNNELISDFQINSKNIINNYENERKTKALTVKKMNSKNKPLSVWDAMSLHDVQKYKQELAANEQRRKEQQRQLKQFYDKQVKDKVDRVR